MNPNQQYYQAGGQYPPSQHPPQYAQQPYPPQQNQQYPQQYPGQYPPQQYPPQQYPSQQHYPPQQQYPPQQFPHQQFTPQQYQHYQPPYPPQQYPLQQYPTQAYSQQPQYPQKYPEQQQQQQQQPQQQQPQLSAQPINIVPLPGAIGDGVQDDTAAVQAALKNAPPNSTLVFPPGTYRITNTLILDKPLTVSGDCTFACDFPAATWSGQARCDNPDTWKQHLLVIRTDGVSVTGIRFANNTNIEGIAAILVEGSNFTFCKCIVSDFCQGLMIGKLKNPSQPSVTYSNINVSNNQFTNIRGVPGGSIAYGDGILFFGCENVVIDGNSLSAAPGRTPRNGINSGPEGFTVSHTVKVTNNRVLGDWDYPLTTEGGKNCLLANNMVEGCCIVGIIERGEDITVRDNVIKIIGGRKHGCTCGIQFYGVDNGLIEKNVVTGAAQHGIACMPSHETNGSGNITIKDNSIEGEFLHGVSKTLVDHNRIILTHKEKGSCGVTGWYTAGLDCRNNDIQATNGTGCIFTGSKEVDMCSNVFTNSRAGLYVARECSTVKVEGNDFTGCKETKHDAFPGLPDYRFLSNQV